MTVMQIVQQLFNSMGITMEIFFVTLVTSLILGLGLALVRLFLLDSMRQPDCWDTAKHRPLYIL